VKGMGCRKNLPSGRKSPLTVVKAQRPARNR